MGRINYENLYQRFQLGNVDRIQFLNFKNKAMEYKKSRKLIKLHFLEFLRSAKLFYLFITCNWLDARWQESFHVTLARTMKILL